jgi:hypothetical protein
MKSQIVGSDIEVYVASLAVGASDTPACTLTTTGAGRDQCGFVFVFSPPTGSAPVIVVPGAQRVEKTTENTILGLSVSDVEGGDIDMTLTCTSGTLDVVSAGTVTTGGLGTSTMTLTGTPTELNTLFTSGITYTQAGKTADTITVDADDSVPLSADQKTIAITLHDRIITDSTQSAVNAKLAQLGLTHDTVEPVTVTMLSIDEGGRTDSDTAIVTYGGVSMELPNLKHRRRRRF